MPELEHKAEIALPTISVVKLNAFSLYSEQPNVAVNLRKSVFCLIGANGLGKTTFLNTLLYGVTGAIPDPERRFVSLSKYVKDASRVERISEYFEGRIAELDRSRASVSVQLNWPQTKLTLNRPLFEDGDGANLRIEPQGEEPTVFDATNT